jgi:hypothetical protein
MSMSDGEGRILSGFNHNLQYKGKTYHIQTEDCGISNPFILSHIFLDGRVIDKLRVSYSEIIVEGGEVKKKVEEMMKKQHLIAIKRLISGFYDSDEDNGRGNED